MNSQGRYPPSLRCSDFLCSFTKQKEVIFTHLLAYLHIGPIQGADGKGTIHGEFHVACA